MSTSGEALITHTRDAKFFIADSAGDINVLLLLLSLSGKRSDYNNNNNNDNDYFYYAELYIVNQESTDLLCEVPYGGCLV